MKNEEGDNNYENNIYYVVLELPFNTLLVHKDAFTDFEDAQDIISSLPWFSIWEKSKFYAHCEKLRSEQGKILFVPIKAKKKRNNTYTLEVSCQIEVESESSKEVHRTLRAYLKKEDHPYKIVDLKTKITKTRISLKR